MQGFFIARPACDDRRPEIGGIQSKVRIPGRWPFDLDQGEPLVVQIAARLI